MWESRIVSREETQQEKRYQRGRGHEEGEARLEWPANLDPSARAARDASLLANTGTNSAFAKMVTARIAHKRITMDKMGLLVCDLQSRKRIPYL